MTIPTLAELLAILAGVTSTVVDMIKAAGDFMISHPVGQLSLALMLVGFSFKLLRKFKR